MRSAHRFKFAAATLAVALLAAGIAPAQTPTPPTSPPPASANPAPPPADANPAAPARQTLLPEAGDPSNVDEVVLTAKPVLILSGTSDWDGGLKNIRESFAKIEAELARLNIVPTGRPIVLYTQTTDDNFKFDAMIPIAAAPGSAPADLAKDMRFGETPSGKAYRFVHKGAYDDIDNTYETITTYLEAKDIVARDAFMEEFVNDVSDAADTKLEANIFVQPK